MVFLFLKVENVPCLNKGWEMLSDKRMDVLHSAVCVNTLQEIHKKKLLIAYPMFLTNMFRSHLTCVRRFVVETILSCWWRLKTVWNWWSLSLSHLWTPTGSKHNSSCYKDRKSPWCTHAVRNKVDRHGLLMSKLGRHCSYPTGNFCLQEPHSISLLSIVKYEQASPTWRSR